MTASRQQGGTLRTALCAGIVLALVCSLPSRAGDLRGAPDGVKLGYWVVEPYAEMGYAYDDNVFRRGNDAIAEGEERLSDSIREIFASVRAVLPFRMSRFEMGYDALERRYSKYTFDRNVQDSFNATFRLNFRSGDELVLRDQFKRGVSDVQTRAQGEGVDEGDRVFVGEPYDRNVWTVQLSRSVRNRQGYLIRVQRYDVTWVNPTEIFFDYRGFYGRFEYRQPLSSRRFLTATYDMRRFNHYDPAERETQTGIAYRNEQTDTYTIGVRGVTGHRKPYSVRVGYSRFIYNLYRRDAQSIFRGIAGFADWRLPVGGRTMLNFRLRRIPLPSNFDTYYVNNDVQVSLERSWRGEFETSFQGRWSGSRYGDLICQDGRGRQDSTVSLDAEVDWLLLGRWGVTSKVSFRNRDSNCVGVSYDATILSAGLAYGWF